MLQLLKSKGFVPLAIVLFINTFVELGYKILIQNSIFKMYNGQSQVILTAVVNALILIPFILLFSPAGFVTDKYPKQQVMRYRALIAASIILLAAFSFYQGWFWSAFFIMLAWGVLATFYSPAKYGYIRELVGEQHLAGANGLMQALGVSAILTGTFLFSFLFEFFLADITLHNPETVLREIAPICWLLLLLTAFELLLTFCLPSIRNINQGKLFSAKVYVRGGYLKSNIKILLNQHEICFAIFGLSLFWATSQAVLAAFPAFAKTVLVEDNTIVVQGIIACTAIGLIIGTLLAGKLSKNKIELRLVPVAAFGLAAMLGFLPLLHNALTMALTFLCIGIFGGLFIIPLIASIQYHAKPEDLGTVLAGNNWVQNIVMVVFLGMTILLARIGITSEHLFIVLMLFAFIGAGYTWYKIRNQYKTAGQ